MDKSRDEESSISREIESLHEEHRDITNKLERIEHEVEQGESERPPDREYGSEEGGRGLPGTYQGSGEREKGGLPPP